MLSNNCSSVIGDIFSAIDFYSHERCRSIRCTNIAGKFYFNINKMQIAPRFNTESKHKECIFSTRRDDRAEFFVTMSGVDLDGNENYAATRRSTRHVNNPATCTRAVDNWPLWKRNLGFHYDEIRGQRIICSFNPAEGSPLMVVHNVA